ncbi:hypothetical protein [Streptomyces sp. NPDC052127]|uniref:hypothetical protein n=1 Tax=Streptomyces sp. NPDC052127 TaxID=3155679 RepID=UPI0034161A4F
MALVRKGSRRIVVDGTAYRWRLRGGIGPQAIQHALREGWAPTAPGSPFRLDQSAGFTSSP